MRELLNKKGKIKIYPVVVWLYHKLILKTLNCLILFSKSLDSNEIVNGSLDGNLMITSFSKPLESNVNKICIQSLFSIGTEHCILFTAALEYLKWK